MIIINKNADFSGCGLGKITFKVSKEVNELLDSLYDNLELRYKLVFQQFIDEIGGLNGEIFSSLYRLVIPAFANSAKECFTDVVTRKVFSSGGGTYDKYAENIETNRGVGAKYDLVNGTNILNFNSIHNFEGSILRGIIFDSATANVPLINAGMSPMYNHACQLIKEGNSSYYNIAVAKVAKNVAIYNIAENNVFTFYDNAEYTKTPSDLDLNHFKSVNSNGVNYSMYNTTFNKITTAMYFLGKGLTLANGRILNDAVWNFSKNLKEL